MRIGERFADLAPAIGKELQRSLGGDIGIQLPQTAGGSIAGIGEDFRVVCFLTLVKRKEVVLGHIDLAPHFQDVRCTLNPFGDLIQSPQIACDILALGAVAARRADAEYSILITERR